MPPVAAPRAQPPVARPPPSADDAAACRALVGRNMVKPRLRSSVGCGVVKKYTHGKTRKFVIRYSDGDEDELTLEALLPLLVALEE